jgi:hypothetical protein
MLDLDHPRTPHVFAASRQEDLILDYCKRISLSDKNARLFMLEVIRPAFAALRWLNGNRFGNAAHIAKSVDQLEQQVEKLARLPQRDPHRRIAGYSERCPVCNEPRTEPYQYDPTPCCPNCLGIIMPSLTRVRSCEHGFGTEAI